VAEFPHGLIGFLREAVVFAKVTDPSHLYGRLISLGIHDILNLLQELFGVHSYLDMLELTFCYYTTIALAPIYQGGATI